MPLTSLSRLSRGYFVEEVYDLTEALTTRINILISPSPTFPSLPLTSSLPPSAFHSPLI